MLGLVNSDKLFKLLNSPLFEDEKEAVYNLFKEGLDPNTCDQDGNSALHKLSHCTDHMFLLRLINKFPFNVHFRNKNGQTPLHLAIEDNNLELAKLLFKKGADIDARDNEGKTPLLTILLYEKEIIEWLVSKGADINAKDNYGVQIIFAPAISKDKEIIDVIFKNGFKFNIEDPFNEALLADLRKDSKEEIIYFIYACMTKYQYKPQNLWQRLTKNPIR